MLLTKKNVTMDITNLSDIARYKAMGYKEAGDGKTKKEAGDGKTKKVSPTVVTNPDAVTPADPETLVKDGEKGSKQ